MTIEYATESEKLFAELCLAIGVQCEKLPEDGRTVPDFNVRVGAVELLVEVAEIGSAALVGPERHRFGREAATQTSKNTWLSAVAVLRHDDDDHARTYLDLYHNDFAKNPIPLGSLDRDRLHEHRRSPATDKRFRDWERFRTPGAETVAPPE